MAILALKSLGGWADTVLESKLVPAVIINGPLNSLQQVQYSTNLANTNAWMFLSNVRLDVTPKSFYDTAVIGERRFYRTRMVGVADTNLVWIPPGTFLMGSPTNENGRGANEGPQTWVTLTKGFLIGRFEVRNAEWLVYSNSLPDPGDTSLENYLQRPVRDVYWSAASNYCNLRTIDEQQRGLIPPGWIYRLPTEAEWEYACRAGSTNPFAIGSGLELRNDAVRQDAMFLGSFPYPTNIVPVGPITSPVVAVGSYAPNGLGLYDMHGNVSELTWDFAGFSLPGGSVTNLVGIFGDTESGNQYVRGGSYTDAGVNCRAAARKFVSISRVGFRVVLIPPEDP